MKGQWARKLPGVLWSYRTTIKTSSEETPFSLTYGLKVMIPIETSVPIAKYQLASKEFNGQQLNHELELFDGKRELASVQTVA